MGEGDKDDRDGKGDKDGEDKDNEDKDNEDKEGDKDGK